ncbi:hypothetical protein CLPUN_12580 [Clostridium puniceum]|uniref:Uncharacterized protein n=1 Tax=Clostridium puniceum TaxID=29367 RepID=A0A1S8TSN1_9CLOT|nr:hypothetical protein [Clostridium puniceum]OOM80592.1 hypothetical protein CLPUN_12580 [Clostridium puniceum]
MGEKEKNFLGFLVLFISIVIFVVVTSYTIDFDMIKVNGLANKMMNYLNENQYEEFFKNLEYDNFSRLDRFTEYQENINQILGEMTNYKNIGTYRNKNANGEDFILIEYDANFSKIPDKTVKINLIFIYKNSDWRASEYKVGLGNINNDVELVKDINYINYNLKEETKEVDEARKLVNSVVQDYDNEDYKQIYKILNNELKGKGDESEFISYLESQHNKYDKISNAKFNGYEIGKDKTEYKFYYYIKDENDKNIYIIFWVQIKDKSYLLGISFSENVW